MHIFFRYAQVSVENRDEPRVPVLFVGNLFQRDSDGILDVLAQILPVLLWDNASHGQSVYR